jgi:hypothetical protein
MWTVNNKPLDDLLYEIVLIHLFFTFFVAFDH